MNKSKGHMLLKTVTFILSLVFTVLCMESIFKEQGPKMVEQATGFWQTALAVAFMPLMAVLSFSFVYLCFRIVVTIYSHLIGDFIYFNLLAFAKAMLVGFVAFGIIMIGILKIIEISNNFLIGFCVLIVGLAIYDLATIIIFFLGGIRK